MATDVEIYHRKHEAFLGSIKCPLRRLRHESIDINPRQYDPKNVARLIEIFKKQECRRLELGHHVPALISQEVYNTLAMVLNQGAEPAFVEPMEDITYLRGRHRIEAARKYLHPDDMWWIVDLYADSLGQAEVDELREEYSNARNFYDGDIYRHLRRATLVGNLDARKRWLSKLKDTKGRDEMTRYLIRIRTTWEKITGGDESLRRMLDAKTVNVLQGRCPRYSKEDEYMLSLQEGDLFATVAQLDKQGLWTRIYEIEHIIPSLHTFLEDTKLLEPCAKIMKKLLPTTCKTTIQQEFSRLHNRQTTWVLQATETSFQEQEEGSSDTAQKAAYRQLWLHAFRHFPEMICQPLRKDRTRPKPAPPVLELVWWSTITTLALDCGFTDVDQTFSDQDKAIYTMAETFLQQVRPPQLYTGDIHGELDRMVQSLITNRKVVAGDTEMSNVGHVIGIKCGSDIASRCGVPFEKAFRKDQKALFLRHIDQSSRQGQQDCVDSFTVKRDIFHSFFGVANEPCTLGARILTRPHPSPPYSSHHPLEPVSEPHYPPEGINPFNSTRPPDLSSEEVDMVPAPDFPSQEVDMVPAPAAQALERPGDMHARHVSREQAIGIFRDYGAASESHQIVVLKHLADRDTFELRQFGRADVIGLGQLVQEGWNYLVPDTNRGKRVKMTTAQDFPKEGFILLTPQQNTKEIKDAIEEEEVDMDDI